MIGTFRKYIAACMGDCPGLMDWKPNLILLLSWKNL